MCSVHSCALKKYSEYNCVVFFSPAGPRASCDFDKCKFFSISQTRVRRHRSIYLLPNKEEKDHESMTTQNLTGQISIVQPIVHLVEKNVSFLCGVNLNLFKKLIVKCQVYWPA